MSMLAYFTSYQTKECCHCEAVTKNYLYKCLTLTRAHTHTRNRIILRLFSILSSFIIVGNGKERQKHKRSEGNINFSLFYMCNAISSVCLCVRAFIYKKQKHLKVSLESISLFNIIIPQI